MSVSDGLPGDLKESQHLGGGRKDTSPPALCTSSRCLLPAADLRQETPGVPFSHGLMIATALASNVGLSFVRQG